MREDALQKSSLLHNLHQIEVIPKGGNMSPTISEKAYTYHMERDKRCDVELREVKRRGGRPEDVKELETHALKNACESEFFDAALSLVGQRVRIQYTDATPPTEHTVVRIAKLRNIRSDERVCFGIVHQDNPKKEEETLLIFPSTKIVILVEEKQISTHSSAKHFY